MRMPPNASLIVHMDQVVHCGTHLGMGHGGVSRGLPLTHLPVFFRTLCGRLENRATHRSTLNAYTLGRCVGALYALPTRISS